MGHIHVDEGAVAAGVERLLAECRAGSEKPGALGVQNRLFAEVLPPYFKTVVREVNRGTQGVDIASAIAALVTNMLISHIKSCIDGSDPDHATAIANDMMMRIGANMCEGLNRIGSDPRVATVKPTPGGRA